jgi:hypothetical protein
VLKRTYPAFGDAGLCAVVPDGTSKAPVLVFDWSLTAAGVMLMLATVLALLMLLPYALYVNVPDVANV